MARSYMIDGTDIVSCVKNGNTQHVALMFPGSPFEIMGDERVSVDNGFTLHEYFNQDTNLKPGSVCSASFESTLLNYDGALTGFNYERGFMLMLGVERNAGTQVSSVTSYPEMLVLGHSTFGVKREYLYVKSGDINIGRYDGSYRHLFAIRGAEASETYYVYIVCESNGSKYIGEVWKVEVGNSVDQATQLSTSSISISDYTYARLEKLAENRSCEAWSFFDYDGAKCQRFIVENGVVEHDILFTYTAHLIGKQPRRTLGKVVTYTASSVASKLDANADAYAGTTFTSARTLSNIRKNILNAVGLDNYSTMNGGSQTFDNNPFAGMTGYTYREFLAYIGESVGKSIREGHRKITPSLTGTIPTGITLDSRLDFDADLSVRSTYGSELFYRGDYFSYDAEEYNVTPIDVIQSKWTDTDIGVSCPLNPSGDNALIVLNNPIYNGDNATEIRARMQYAFDALTGDGSGNFTPAVMEGPSRLITEVGDVIRVILDEADNRVWIPVYAMTTTWSGAAEYVIECTGDKRLNQWDNHEFRKELRDGNKVHEIIVDIEQSYSRIMDTLTQNYSTIQQTSDLIVAYVGNNAYEKVSGIAITTDGVDITGSKYVKLSSAGYVKCGDYWSFESDGLWYENSDESNTYKMFMGETKSSYSDDIYAAITTAYKSVPTPGATQYRDVTGEIELYLRSISMLGSPHSEAYTGRIRFDTTNAGYPRLYAKWSEGSSGTSLGHGSLGTSSYYWGQAYIKNVHYNTLTQESSIDAKHSIQPMAELGDLIDRLQPVTYEYNGDDTHKKRYGLIHEWTVDVMPDICVGDRYAETKDKAINYMELVPILLREIQSLRSRIKNLEQNTDKSTV